MTTEREQPMVPHEAATPDEKARIRKYRAALAAARMRGLLAGDRTEMARAAIEIADAEQAELRAALTRVEALADGWEELAAYLRTHHSDNPTILREAHGHTVAAESLRAALAGPTQPAEAGA